MRYVGNWREHTAVAPLIIALAALMLLRPGMPSATAAGGGDAYVPVQDELNARFAATLPGYTATWVPGAADGWDAVAHYAVSFQGAAPSVSLSISASVLATSDQARLFYQSVAQRLETGNDPLRGGENLQEAIDNGVDELRDFYRTDVDSAGHRVGSYGRLVRSGRAVALVETIGDPEAEDRCRADEDHCWVDNSRGLVLVRSIDVVVDKLHSHPVDHAQVAPGQTDFAPTTTAVSAPSTGPNDQDGGAMRWPTRSPRASIQASPSSA
jgi:hypothetical protein